MATYGVYMIENESAKKAYVGVSKDVENRVSGHIREIKSRTHYSVSLVEDWFNFGEEYYKFYVLEVLHPHHYGPFYEKKWIKILRDAGYTLYNVQGHREDMERYNLIIDNEEFDGWSFTLRNRIYKRALKLIDSAVSDFRCSDSVDAVFKIELRRVDMKRKFNTESKLSCKEKYKSNVTSAGKRFLNNGEVS